MQSSFWKDKNELSSVICLNCIDSQTDYEKSGQFRHYWNCDLWHVAIYDCDTNMSLGYIGLLMFWSLFVYRKTPVSVVMWHSNCTNCLVDNQNSEYNQTELGHNIVCRFFEKDKVWQTSISHQTLDFPFCWVADDIGGSATTNDIPAPLVRELYSCHYVNCPGGSNTTDQNHKTRETMWLINNHSIFWSSIPMAINFSSTSWVRRVKPMEPSLWVLLFLLTSAQGRWQTSYSTLFQIKS